MSCCNLISILSLCFLLVGDNDAFASPVPDTGDTAERTCNPHFYTAHGKDIIKDTVTGLMWQKDTAPGTYTWDEANTYCASLSLGGYSDWRLPTVKELSALVDSSIQTPGPTIDTIYFSDTGQSRYWSSTVGRNGSGKAWLVGFSDGAVDGDRMSYSRNVRAVRGQGANNNFVDNGDGTITDTSTGLMWEKSAGLTTSTWVQAKAYCDNLTLGGQSDWRLPTRNELQTIVDYTLYDLSIDTTFFPSTVASYYWSSTVFATGKDSVWIVGFDGGFVDEDIITSTFYARAVRAGQCGASDSCPIANLLGKENPKLENLRNFRNSTLAHFAIGRKIIEIYYNNADSINAALDNNPVLRTLTKQTLEAIAPLLGMK